jgi:DNA-directed RNA polymerase specialized sigma24 family protein
MSQAAVLPWVQLSHRRGRPLTHATLDEAALLQRALAGHPPALRELVAHLTPTVQAKVARALLSGGRNSHQRNIREEVRDLSQDIFAVLFDDNAHVLRSWDSDRGIPLRGFVGVVAQRRAISALRTSRRNPWTEDPTDCTDLDHLRSSTRHPDRQLIARELLDKAIAKVRANLSPRGITLFTMIIADDATNAEIMQATELSADSVYQWRSRLMKALRNELRALGADAQ